MLDTKNGYQVPRELLCGSNQIPESIDELDSLIKDIEIREKNAAQLTYNGKLSLARPEPKFVPSFVIFDKLVLRFKAYFKQTMHDSTEQYLLRVVLILYYLEDDSIAVVEPPQPNSGIFQGVLIKRQRLPKSSTEFFTLTDFNIGINLTFYKKTYRIVDCDAFTKNYLESKTTIKLNPPEPVPVDKYLMSRIRPTPTRSTGSCEDDKLWKFLNHDRHVLRFYCTWEDDEEQIVREFVMHYYLVDDCVEVKEVHKPNDGRDVQPLMLKRQKLPLAFHDLEDLTHSKSYYTWHDFSIGSVVNVLNRRFQIHDCDEYTRGWYKENGGLEMVKFPDAPTESRKQPRQFPPHNGFGSEEDSLQSCLHLVLQAPKKEWSRLQLSEVLRYVAQMESRHHQNQTRKFIISVYLPEQQVSIYEPPQRNSGTLGGKFLEKCKVRRPDGTSYYTADQFYIGATLQINAHVFRVVDADEHVITYMEAHPLTYPMACVETVVGKLKSTGSLASAIKGVLSGHACADQKVPLNTFRSCLGNSPDLCVHEILTLYRHQDYVRQSILKI